MIVDFFKDNKIVIIVFILAILFQAMFIFRPVSFLIANVLPDDSFYYFQIARNLSSGLGSTFDGLNQTNGYHPLWMLVLIPIWKMFSIGGVLDVVPIYMTLAVSLFLNIFTGLALLFLISKYTQSNLLKVGVLSVWFFNPFNFYEMLSGLETPLSVLLILVFIIMSGRVQRSATTQSLVLAGIVGGLMMLARLDNVFYFIAFLAWIFIAGSEGRWKNIFTTGLSATAVVLPWLLFNWLKFGMFFTSSSISTTVVNRGLIVQDHGDSIFQMAKASIYTMYNGLTHVLSQTGAPAIFLVGFGVAIGWFIFKNNFYLEGIKNYRMWPVEIYLFFGFVVLFVINTGVRLVERSWYFIAFNIFVAMFFAWFLEKSKNDIPKNYFVVGVLAISLAFFFYVGWSRELKDRQIAQLEMYAATTWMNDNLHVDSKIGVFNAGVQAYFSKHKVVNLDGLVNNNASKALLEKNLWNYVKDEKIEYISDFDIYMKYRYKSFFGIDDVFVELTPKHNIRNISHARSSAGITIYKVSLP